jgi:hypothetical protein
VDRHDLAHQAEADAAALPLGVIEWHENLLALLCRDARTVIGHGKRDAAAAFLSGAERDFSVPSVAQGPDGVAYQVDERLVEQIDGGGWQEAPEDRTQTAEKVPG